MSGICQNLQNFTEQLPGTNDAVIHAETDHPEEVQRGQFPTMKVNTSDYEKSPDGFRFIIFK